MRSSNIEGRARGLGVALGVALPLTAALVTAGCPGKDPFYVDAAGGGGEALHTSSSSHGPGPGPGPTVSSTVTSTVGPGPGPMTGTGPGPGPSSSAGMGGGGAPGVGGATTGVGGVGGEGGGGCPFPLCNGECKDLDQDPDNCGACARPCSTRNAVQRACDAGACEPTCDVGFGDGDTPPANQDDDGCETAWRRVFVTSQVILPTFGGAAGGDALCQSFANQQGLGGTWFAWLSDGSSSPSTHFNQSKVPYALLDLTVVAQDYAQLTSGALSSSINVDETDAMQPLSEVWTGTNVDGTPAGDTYCTDWSMTSGTNTSTVGQDTQSDLTWTSAFEQFCDRDNVRLYCFEQ
ncbi:MAG TPA: hypothetical protein VGM56_13550 [Byssovorax sp.]|jgi:hypothetical protein